MSNTWETPPPLPNRGDNSAEAVFLGVGKTLTGWETIEFELSRLYSVFAGNPDGDAMREYGKPTIARLRLDRLAEAASRFFIKQPSQQREGQFYVLLSRFRHFATRRNEIAHGIVFNIEPIEAFNEHLAPEVRGKPQYALIAPYYQIKQHAPDGLPAYAYTSLILEAMIPAMAQPYNELATFRQMLLNRPPPGPSRPSALQEKRRRRNALQRRARRQQRRVR